MEMGSHKDREKLSGDVINVSSWLIANKLKLSTTKTDFMLIGLKQRLCTATIPPRLSINGAHIEQLTTAKTRIAYR